MLLLSNGFGRISVMQIILWFRTNLVLWLKVISKKKALILGVICPVARREDVQMFIAFVALYEYIFLSNGCQNGFSQWLKKAFTVLSKAPVHDIALLLVYVLVIKRLRSTHQRGPNGSFSVVKLIKNAHQEKLKCFLPLQCVVSDMDKYQMLDMDVKYNRIPMYCESQEHVERGTVEIYFVGTEYQLADLFTKALPKERFEYLVHRIGVLSYFGITEFKLGKDEVYRVSVMIMMDAQAQGRQECSKEKEESREECSKSRKTKKMKCLEESSQQRK
ncbi:hypothetical protein Tco_1437092 [Tanacetum coccineum]